MNRTLLVPVNFSEASFFTLREAIAVSTQKQLSILVVHVCASQSEVSFAHDRMRSLLVSCNCVGTDSKIIVGDPKTCIVELANRESVAQVYLSGYKTKMHKSCNHTGILDYIDVHVKCPIILVKYLNAELQVQED